MYVTPCIGICQIKGDECVGCKRTLVEIANWTAMNDDERMVIMRRLGFARRSGGRVTKLKKSIRDE